MSPRTYARLFLCVPLLVGATADVLMGGIEVLTVFVPDMTLLPFGMFAFYILLPFTMFAFYLIVGSKLALLPYGAFAVAALLFLRNHPPATYFQWAKWAPIAFLPFFAIALYAVDLFGQAEGFVAEAASAALLSLISLPCSYSYVGMFYLVALLLPDPRHERSDLATDQQPLPRGL